MKTMRTLRRSIGDASTAFALILLVALIAVAVLAPVFFGAEANRIDVDVAGLGPSAEHWLGTNQLGQDIALRVLVATRLSLLLAAAATLVSVVTGVLLGAAPTLFGKASGRVVDSVISVSIAFPGLLLVLFLAVIFGVSTPGAVLAIGLSGVPYKARLVRNLIRSIETRDYVAAAHLVGGSRVRVLVRHVLPNVAEPLIINTATTAGGAVLSFAGLSFLGIGVQAPAYDWGQLLNEGQKTLYTNPLAVVGPGVAVVLAGLALNILGDSAARRFALGEMAPKPARTAASAPSATVRNDLPDEAAALEVRDLAVTYRGGARQVHAVRGVNLTISPGEAVGVVGESGSGKSAMAMGIAQLIERPSVVTADRMRLSGVDLLSGSPNVGRHLAAELTIVFQDPMSSFNPVRRLGRQLTDGIRFHERISRLQAIARLIAGLERVGIRNASSRVEDYPHQFSGGMRQRAMIATALTQKPSLIIADEPTTALDVTTENRVLEYLGEVRADTQAALLLISHDLTVIRRACERVVVMYAGRVVEDLPVDQLATRAAHPYTRALIDAVPTIETDRDRPLRPIPGRVPDLTKDIAECAFANRCPFASARCRDEEPALLTVGDAHRVACWHPYAPALVHATQSDIAVEPGGEHD
ncbi:dipeptide/oligopeptide/nickel ABC transporter permease/ATP-binding protein [Streptomyces sp. NPDC088816]|uniref:dipeptide/oligopeptide/nickel ABC transporter permease/ATP-binding protein n=1 Tax=unclassified Streptomyces TaxID=2593676 RepID=UPI0037F82AC7